MMGEFEKVEEGGKKQGKKDTHSCQMYEKVAVLFIIYFVTGVILSKQR